MVEVLLVCCRVVGGARTGLGLCGEVAGRLEEGEGDDHWVRCLLLGLKGGRRGCERKGYERNGYERNEKEIGREREGL